MPPRFSTRFAAFHVDTLVFALAFEALHLWLLQRHPEGISTAMMIWLMVIVTFLFSVLPTLLFGQTLGKKIYGLKVISAGKPGTKLDVLQLIEREVILKTFGAFFFGFGFWRARRDPQARAWHDMRTGTLVVSVAAESRSPFLAKVLEFVISVVTLVAGVAIIVWAFFSTALGLPAIQAQLNGAGIVTTGMTGSIARGITIATVDGDGPTGKYHFENLVLQIAPLASVQEGRYVINKFKIDAGTIEVASNFSWPTFLKGTLLSLSTPAAYDGEADVLAAGASMPLRFRVDLLDLSQLKLVTPTQSAERTLQSHIESLVVKDILIDFDEVSASSFASVVDRVRLAGTDLTLGGSTLKFAGLKSQFGFPLSPGVTTMVDFEARGEVDIAATPLLANSSLVGSFLRGAGKFTLDRRGGKTLNSVELCHHVLPPEQAEPILQLRADAIMNSLAQSCNPGEVQKILKGLE